MNVLCEFKIAPRKSDIINRPIFPLPVWQRLSNYTDEKDSISLSRDLAD